MPGVSAFFRHPPAVTVLTVALCMHADSFFRSWDMERLAMAQQEAMAKTRDHVVDEAGSKIRQNTAYRIRASKRNSLVCFFN
uniref:Putative secreted protein n=1 Tax=Anopheles triannulatus TaxID=58253 RepID=A0A2M4B3K6_9DIPT